MTTFDERERAFENLYIHDEELRFKAVARRNRAVAAWAAARMGLDADAAAAYEAEVVGFGVGHAEDEELVRRLHADLAKAGRDVSDDDVRAEMARRLAEAVAYEKSA